MKRSGFTTAVAMLALALALALAACSSPGGGGGGGYTAPGTGGGSSETTGTTGGTTIVEKNSAFDPASLTVKVGDTVTFDNQDSVIHEIEVDGTNLGQQQGGEKVTWKAEQAGQFPVRCLIHPSMVGAITVE